MYFRLRNSKNTLRRHGLVGIAGVRNLVLHIMAGPIRQPIDIKRLEAYIEQRVPEIQIPIDVKQFGYGQSNPTYLVTDKNGFKFVMRKKPPGKLLSKTAHRVDREYRILHALEDTDVAVPKTYCLCEDDGVIGTPFYIMKFLEGRIYEDPSIPNVAPQERNEMWHDAVRTLAKFHRVDPKSVNMESFGKPKGFYNRQLQLFNTLSEAQASTVDVETKVPVGKIPHFDDMVSFFSQQQSQPKDRGTFIHGDYKIDNMIFHPTEPRVIGILDWEMSTIGHPLADVSNLLFPFVTANDPVARRELTSAAGSATTNESFLPGKTPGLPTFEQCVEWYGEVSGWTPTKLDLSWGNAFMAYKSAIIMQGIGARYAVRQASSTKAKDHGEKMKPLGEVAWSLTKACMEGTEKARL